VGTHTGTDNPPGAESRFEPYCRASGGRAPEPHDQLTPRLGSVDATPAVG
jgi:hypothetical protein